MNEWLSYYHPSTAVFVDDQKEFLNALKYVMPSNLSALYFTNPLQAIEQIKQSFTINYNNFFKLNLLEDQLDIKEQGISDVIISIQWDELTKVVSNIKRFSIPSVVIVDYMMPEMDGISFCRQLKELPIKKIILTANADHLMAIQAFNEGIIDGFLLKDSPNLINQLNKKIKEMQYAYFYSQAKNNFGGLLNTLAPLFNNEALKTLHEQLIQEFQAVEFYLLDRWGSMLFITYEGKAITLIISSVNCMDTYSSIAADHEEFEIAEILLSRKKILFFPRKVDTMRPVSDWDKFLFKAFPLKDNTEYYYTVISDEDLHPICSNKIQSQETYQK